MKQAKLNRNCHSVHLLTYHLVLVTKYRKRVITKAIANKLKQMFNEQIKNNNGKLIEFGYEQDHIHILYQSTPQTCQSKLINAYKSSTSRIIKKEYPETKKQLWKQYFWSRSYCLLTTGSAPIETIKKYIENQNNETGD